MKMFLIILLGVIAGLIAAALINELPKKGIRTQKSKITLILGGLLIMAIIMSG